MTVRVSSETAKPCGGMFTLFDWVVSGNPLEPYASWRMAHKSLHGKLHLSFEGSHRPLLVLPISTTLTSSLLLLILFETSPNESSVRLRDLCKHWAFFVLYDGCGMLPT